MLLYILLPNALIVAIAVIYLVYHFCKKRACSSSRVKNLNTVELALLVLHAVCGPFVAALLTGDAEGFLAMTLTFFVSLPLSIGSFMVGIRRLHDLNRTGWFMLLVFIPVVNLIFAIYLLFFKGTEGYNNYGADPLQF